MATYVGSSSIHVGPHSQLWVVSVREKQQVPYRFDNTVHQRAEIRRRYRTERPNGAVLKSTPANPRFVRVNRGIPAIRTQHWRRPIERAPSCCRPTPACTSANRARRLSAVVVHRTLVLHTAHCVDHRAAWNLESGVLSPGVAAQGPSDQSHGAYASVFAP